MTISRRSCARSRSGPWQSDVGRSAAAVVRRHAGLCGKLTVLGAVGVAAPGQLVDAGRAGVLAFHFWRSERSASQAVAVASGARRRVRCTAWRVADHGGGTICISLSRVAGGGLASPPNATGSAGVLTHWRYGTISWPRRAGRQLALEHTRTDQLGNTRWTAPASAPGHIGRKGRWTRRWVWRCGRPVGTGRLPSRVRSVSSSFAQLA